MLPKHQVARPQVQRIAALDRIADALHGGLRLTESDPHETLVASLANDGFAAFAVIHEQHLEGSSRP